MTPCYFKLRKGLKYHCDKTFFDDNKLFGRDNLTRKYGEVIRIVKIKKGVRLCRYISLQTPLPIK